MPSSFRRATLSLLLAGVVVNASLANASEFERVAPVTHALTQKECGECHMAFQPGLLPAASWNRVMDGLSDHFGEKASLPADSVAAIRAYLTQNAGGGDGRLIRVTDQEWWRRKHRLDSAVWRRKTVGSKSNCEACHREAGKGLYEDE
jgi:nitrate/TMAO reductase-like tetraheme cytochrome c subunit